MQCATDDKTPPLDRLRDPWHLGIWALAGISLLVVWIMPARGAAGSHMVRDIETLRTPHLPPPCPLSPCPLPEPVFGSLPSRIVAMDGGFLFRARDGIHGLEPWVTDGSKEGTSLLADLNEGEADSALLPMASVGGRMVFWASVDTPKSSTWSLMSTDGSSAGTHELAMPCGERCDPEPSDPRPHLVYQGHLYFSARDEALGRQALYRTDGIGSVELVKDLCSYSGPCSRVEELVEWHDDLLVVEGWQGARLRRVTRVAEGSAQKILAECTRVEKLTSMGSGLVFFGECSSGTGTRKGLFALDGGEGSPRFVGDLEGGAPDRILPADDGLYVSTTLGPSWSRDWILWHLDPAALAALELATFDEVTALSALKSSLLLAGRQAEDQEVALWVLEPGGAPRLTLDRRVTTSFAVSGGRAYFAASDPAHGTEVWRTDGTSEGSALLADVNPGPASSNPTDSGIGMSDFAIGNGLLLFAAHHPDFDIEPWVVPLDAEPVDSPCVPDEETLCLHDRFRVTAEWRDYEGATGQGQAKPLERDTGAFWFFRHQNLEIMVKVLDACAPPWNAYWVFAGGLTNVEVTLRVEDLIGGEVREYRNGLGSRFTPIQDAKAFTTCP